MKRCPTSSPLSRSRSPGQPAVASTTWSTTSRQLMAIRTSCAYTTMATRLRKSRLSMIFLLSWASKPSVLRCPLLCLPVTPSSRTLAKTTSPEEVGRATGELCTAMAEVQLDHTPPIPPYYDVFNVHWAISKEKFYEDAASNPAFKVCCESMDYLVDQIRAIEPKLEAYQQLGLPMQLIHGDLHYDNVMVLGDTVSGLLDFEFCAYDWRVMELAVALSKYVGEGDPLSLITDFVSGYAKKGQLSNTEIEILPDLINLRIFSNVIYFTGRALAKEDGIDSLTSRADSYAKRVRWVNANREAIVSAVKDKMLALATVAA